jgi:phosphoesterase RecJ-like protein
MSNPMRRVQDALNAASTILIVMHVHPDGDTTGSALALSRILTERGKVVSVVCADPVEERYHFLTQGQTILNWEAVAEARFDAVVTLDCGDIRRTGNATQVRSAGDTLINIDHHASNPGFGDINWVDRAANATGVLVYQMVKDWGHPVSDSIAQALYTSLSTDTGSFMYPWTSAESLSIASDLARHITAFGPLNRALWAHRTWNETALAGWALTHVKASPSQRVVWVSLPYDVMQGLNATDADADAIIDWIRPIQTAEVAVVLRQLEPGEAIKVSWRSSCFDVAEWAHQFGGGGHSYSSAAILQLTLEAAEEAVLKPIREVIW